MKKEGGRKLNKVKSVLVTAYPEWPMQLGLPANVQQNIPSKESQGLKTENKSAVAFKIDESPSGGNQEANEADTKKWLFADTSCYDLLENEQLADAPRCSFRLACEGAKATRMCYNCVKFDATKTGYFCEGCFDKRHPPYRKEHSWVSITDISNHKQEWLRQVARFKMEQDMEELKILHQQTKAFTKETVELGKEIRRDRGIGKAMKDIEMIDKNVCGLIDNLRKQIKRTLTRDDAVKRIQDAWKLRIAKRNIRAMIRSVYQQFIDPTTGKLYYYNKVTQKKSWTKPLLLGEEELEPSKKKVKKVLTAENIAVEEAASFIQRAYRSRRAIHKLRLLILEAYVRILDSNTNSYYYFNTKTGTVSWIKPKFLGNEEVSTPRTKEKEKKAKKLLARKQKEVTPVRSEEESARVIQGMCRAHQSRKYFRKLISSVYAKIYHEASNRFYYHNTRTGAVTWTRPRNVNDEDLLTPRSFQKAVAEEKRRLKVKKAGGEPLTREDFARRIQGMFRTYKSRKHFRKLISSVYAKIYHEESGRFYYHNTRSGVVSWMKPRNVNDEDLLTPRSLQLWIEEEKKKERKKKDQERKEKAKSIRKGPMTRDEAAFRIQGMFRCHQARFYFRKLISSVYEKILDQNTGKYYYHNTKTKQVSWVKPPNVTDDELLTPRSRELIFQAKVNQSS